MNNEDDPGKARSVRAVSASFHKRADRISELGKTLQAAAFDIADETRSHVEYLEAQNKLLQDEIEALRTEIREWRTKSGRLK